jgi:hypothetical protein
VTVVGDLLNYQEYVLDNRFDNYSEKVKQLNPDFKEYMQYIKRLNHRKFWIT